LIDSVMIVHGSARYGTTCPIYHVQNMHSHLMGHAF